MRGPDFEKNMVVAPQGYGVPIGKPINYPDLSLAKKEEAQKRYKKN